jgi:hypothetical protein
LQQLDFEVRIAVFTRVWKDASVPRLESPFCAAVSLICTERHNG